MTLFAPALRPVETRCYAVAMLTRRFSMYPALLLNKLLFGHLPSGHRFRGWLEPKGMEHINIRFGIPGMALIYQPWQVVRLAFASHSQL